MKVSALILARKGSRSIPGKNIKHLNGLPLICHSLKVLANCPCKYSDHSNYCKHIDQIVHQSSRTFGYRPIRRTLLTLFAIMTRVLKYTCDPIRQQPIGPLPCKLCKPFYLVMKVSHPLSSMPEFCIR